MSDNARCEEEPAAREKFLNLPNLLTCLRFCLVPVFIVFMIEKNRTAALAVFSLAGLTDVLDGMAARKWHLRTRVGMLLDPLADKSLLVSAFILLTIRSLNSPLVIPVWLTGTVLARDLIIVLGALAISLLGKSKEFPPSLYGKISTVCQVITVIWVLVANVLSGAPWTEPRLAGVAASPSVAMGVFSLTLFFTVLSGADYIRRGIGLVFSSNKKGRVISRPGR